MNRREITIKSPQQIVADSTNWRRKFRTPYPLDERHFFIIAAVAWYWPKSQRHPDGEHKEILVLRYQGYWFQYTRNRVHRPPKFRTRLFILIRRLVPPRILGVSPKPQWRY
jgi:hypothetical protein